MAKHKALSADAAQVEEKPPGTALPKNEASPPAEMDEASSTPEVRPDTGRPPGQ